MGEYYVFANPTKREYLSPGDLGWNDKRSGLLLGVAGTALSLLLTRGAMIHPLCGSWSGDEVIVTGDEAHSHLSTDGTQGSILYDQAKDSFENISDRAIEMLCLFHEHLATEFVQIAMTEESLFTRIARLVYAKNCPRLEAALISVMGKDWPRWHSKKRGR
jgi:hypothetical protein